MSRMTRCVDQVLGTCNHLHLSSSTVPYVHGLHATLLSGSNFGPSSDQISTPLAWYGSELGFGLDYSVGGLDFLLRASIFRGRMEWVLLSPYEALPVKLG